MPVDKPARLSIRIAPRKRLVLSMHPYLVIPPNADGTGGGIRLRVYGEGPDADFVDVAWGETTEIEVQARQEETR